MLVHINVGVLGLAFCAILEFKEQQLHLYFFACCQSTLNFATGLPNDT
jgi:hypothetical protein